MIPMKEYINPNQLKQLRGELFENELLAPYTSWKVGGPAAHFYKPANIEDLAFFLSVIPQSEVVVFMGWGSNLLVQDSGFSGTVILTRGLLTNIELNESNNIYAEAGVSIIHLARFAAGFGLGGFENIAGIPGTVGGALAMNAGAYGSQTWDFVEQVKTIDRSGEIFVRHPADYNIGYRSVSIPVNEWFISAVFKLQSGDKESILLAIQNRLDRRAARQPLELPNAGSVFRNPPGDYSARLIEASGLKGYRIGGASVSAKHVNFIVNDQNATAGDIEKLIQYIAATIVKDHGVKLLREVRVLTDEGIKIDHE